MTTFEGIENLSPQEKQFLACLEVVSDTSLWGTAISNVMKAPTVVKIRQLVGDLKSQAGDNRDMMFDILGEPCYEQLLNL
jgi:hypothetical protein